MQGNTETPLTTTAQPGALQISKSYSEILSSPAVISTLAGRGQLTPSPLQAQAMAAILLGSDTIITCDQSRERCITIGLCIADFKARPGRADTTLIVGDIGSDDRADFMGLADFGLSVAFLENRGEAPKNTGYSILAGAPQTISSAAADGAISLSSFGRLVILAAQPLSTSDEGACEAILRSASEHNLQKIWFGCEHAPASLARFFQSPQQVIAQSCAHKIPVSHVYYEVGSELLAKPNVLAQAIEGAGFPPTIIFCNTPSDTDFVHVMLRKRGISSLKLIGHLPQFKVSKVARDLASREITALVATDIGARGVEVDDIPLVINHSIPSDPEVYLHRAGHSDTAAVARTVVSLVSPMDIGSFHYLKKIVHLDFKKVEPPSEDEILAQKLRALREKAAEFVKTCSPAIQRLADAVLEGPNKAELLALLLHNTFNAQAPQAPATQHEGERGQFRDDDRRGGGDSDRWGGGDSDRWGGGDRARGRDDRSRGQRRGRYGGDDEQSDIEGRGGRNRGEDDFISSNGDSEHRAPEPRSGGRSPERRVDAPPPPVRDVRVYLGHGTKNGLTEDILMAHFREKCGLADDAVRRVTMRGSYAFVDFSEEAVDGALEKLETTNLVEGEKLFARKAAILTSGRGGGAAAGEDEFRPSTAQQAVGAEEDLDAVNDQDSGDDGEENY